MIWFVNDVVLDVDIFVDVVEVVLWGVVLIGGKFVIVLKFLVICIGIGR